MNFKDQFDRRDPLEFVAFGIFDLWPRQVAWEARALLVGRTTNELKAIAQHIEGMISDQVALLVKTSQGLRDSSYEGNPKTWLSPADIRPRTAEELRSQHGDINLYTAEAAEKQQRLFGAEVSFSTSEGYAVLALWKLIDWVDAMTAPQRGQEAAYPLPPIEKRYSAVISATPFLLDALRACTLAAESKLRADHMLALTSKAQRDVAVALDRAEQARRRQLSDQNRRAVEARHEKTLSHKERALALATTKPFAGYADAARYIADNLEKSPGKYYTTRSIEQWLKDAGWKPRQSDEPTS